MRSLTTVSNLPGEENMSHPIRNIVALAISGVLVFSAHAQTGGTLEKIRETKVVTIGHREASIPFSYYNDKQQVVGYANEICLRVVDAIKANLKMPDLKVAYGPVTSSNRIPLLANGTVDMECGSTANLPERWTQAAFSNTYFLTGTRYLAKKSSGAKTIADLKGATVASTAGTANLTYLQEANKKLNLGMRVIAANDHAEGFMMVETGRAKAFVLDDVLLASLIAASKEPAAYFVSDEEFAPALPYSIMVRKDDAAFKKVVDDATAQLYKSPEMKVLYDKWFTKPIPSNGINLNLPVSPAMLKAFASPTDTYDLTKYGK